MRIAPLMACSAALLLSPAFAGDKVEYGPVPAWVKPVARPVNDDTMSQAPIKSMLQVMQFRFAATGSESYTETFTRVQTPQGLTALGNFSLPWRPDSDVLTVHRFQLLRGEQVIDILAAGQTFEILRRENNLERAALDGILTATIQPHGMEVGDVLNVAFTVRRVAEQPQPPRLLPHREDPERRHGLRFSAVLSPIATTLFARRHRVARRIFMSADSDRGSRARGS